MVGVMEEVRDYRRANSDSYNYNWLLKIPPAFQHPFEVTHESMRGLRLYREQPEDSLLLLVERKDDGGRTFRIVEGTPLAIASGTDLYA